MDRRLAGEDWRGGASSPTLLGLVLLDLGLGLVLPMDGGPPREANKAVEAKVGMQDAGLCIDGTACRLWNELWTSRVGRS